MTAQIEVKFGRVANSNVDSCASWYVVASTAAIFVVAAKQAGVMTLLYHDKRDARLVANLEHSASFTDSSQLMRQDLK